ncbi:hypothetical protein V9T40_000265 [Parthenolecanium corni]|uniref:G-protein coupled receptors family 1 profile domain-containing protein n=1 Tax=Parthenolecanium corni TaxID=536013 RepID=A0AAN9TAR7_9HEMI
MYSSEEVLSNITSANFTSIEYYTHHNQTEEDVVFNNPFQLPLWEKLLWNSLFLPMVVVATGGNVIVMWIVWSHKRMRTVTNIFLVNLAIADTMVSTLNVTFNFAYMLSGDWVFGKLYCKISQFVAVLSICASVFTLTAVATDR